MQGSGREFLLFDSRGGSDDSDDSSNYVTVASDGEDEYDGLDEATRKLLDEYRRAQISARNRARYSGRSTLPTPKFVQDMEEWWSKQVAPKMPKIVCRVNPSTTLKIRKTFRPLKTIVRLRADYNTQKGVWQFQSSWEDEIIGGKLTLAGKELQLTKSWQFSVGAFEDMVTRLRVRAAVNLQTFQAYARVGFRTERLSPLNIMEGFTIMKQLPLDRSRGNVKLEVRANVALPQPELSYNSENEQSFIGSMGDVAVSLNELNLLLDY